MSQMEQGTLGGRQGTKRLEGAAQHAKGVVLLKALIGAIY
jgi:hypothetical protein